MEKTIDIDKILHDKMGDKAGLVPRFLVKWLKGIVHEDEVNRYLWESRDKQGTDWLEECVRYLRMTLVPRIFRQKTMADCIRLSRTILLVVPTE